MVTEAYLRAARDGIAAAARHLGRSTSDTRRLLSNRVYLGEVRHATAGRNLTAHEPLTDLGTWTAAQIKPRQRAHSVAYPLSGIARCAGCGGPLTGQLSKDRQGSRGRRYRCSRRRSDACVSIGANVLEAHTRAVIAEAIGAARPVLSPGTDALAQADEALRIAETTLNAYAADTELQADLGIEAYRAGARERREALQAAQRAYQEESARASAIVTLPAVDELDDDQQLTRALAAIVEAIEVSGGRRAVEDRVSVRWAIDSHNRNRVPALDSLSERGYGQRRLLEANRGPPSRSASGRDEKPVTIAAALRASRFRGWSNTRHLPSGRIRAPALPAAAHAFR